MERIAALETIKKHKEIKIEKVLDKNGIMIQNGWKELADKHDLNISIMGIKPLSYFSFEYKNDKEIKTLFIQEMLKKGFLSTTGYYASFSHKENDIREYLEAVNETFDTISKAVRESTVKKLLTSEICHSGFRRLA